MPKPILAQSNEYYRFNNPVSDLVPYIRHFSSHVDELHDALDDPMEIDLVELDDENESPLLSQQVFYSRLENLFREDIDAQSGIVRTVEQNVKYPTGVAAIRDATAAKAILDPTIDHYRVEANNVLLRALGRLRGIDHVLSKKSAEEPAASPSKQAYDQLRRKLQNDFATLANDIFKKADETKLAASDSSNKAVMAEYQKAISSIEKQFNTTTLCEVLHDAHLDQGCVTPKDYESLLFHYRNLAALIDPAKSLVTVSLDKTNGVLHRITQDPITEKSEKQKHAIIADMSKTKLFPSGEEKTFQTKQLMGMQLANHYFTDLAAQDNRMLGAQTRKSHLHGLKNAFFVTNELIFNVTEESLDQYKLLTEAANPDDKQYFARSATPVYIGGGETDERLQEATRANIDQARQFVINRFQLEPEPAAATRIHFTALVTDSPMEHQNLMIRHTYDATRRNPDSQNDVSYAPCNWDGTHRRIDLSSLITDNAPSIHPTPSNQAERYRRAAQISVEVRNQHHVLELVACASGQDRTETESERASQEWARQRYLDHHIQIAVTDEVRAQTGDAIEQTRATSRNSAEINAHTVGGSRGCKNDSRGKTAGFDYDNLYSRETDQAMYLESARTNKSNKIDKKRLQLLIEKPSAVAEQSYTDALASLKAACERRHVNPDLKAAGEAVIQQAQTLKEHIKPKDMGSLISVMHQSTVVVAGPKPGYGSDPLARDKRNKEIYADEIAHLGALSKGLSQKPLWKKIANTLLFLGGVALIAAGILFAIPSGGSSLLACLLGAKAIVIASVALGIKAAASVGTAVALTGASAAYQSQTKTDLQKEKGLFDAVDQLKQASRTELNDEKILAERNEEAKDEPESQSLLRQKPQH
jgi:hypothetical protein